jgi:very-short-patch-repair endonuclease
MHRSRLQDAADFTFFEEIRVTSVARTLLDLAAVVPSYELARALDRAERLERFDLAALEDVLSRAGKRRGTAALRHAIAAWRPRQTRSELEDRHEELVRAAGLPAPQLNVLLQGEQAEHEVDAFWPAHRLVVQLDGFAYHRTRRDRERDAATDADLELSGYRVVRLTWDDVALHEARTARRLRRLLAS